MKPREASQSLEEEVRPSGRRQRGPGTASAPRGGRPQAAQVSAPPAWEHLGPADCGLRGCGSHSWGADSRAGELAAALCRSSVPPPAWEGRAAGEQWIETWSLHTMDYSSAVRKDKYPPFTSTWMELESTMLSAVSQSEKDKHYMVSFIWGI